MAALSMASHTSHTTYGTARDIALGPLLLRQHYMRSATGLYPDLLSLVSQYLALSAVCIAHGMHDMHSTPDAAYIAYLHVYVLETGEWCDGKDVGPYSSPMGYAQCYAHTHYLQLHHVRLMSESLSHWTTHSKLVTDIDMINFFNRLNREDMDDVSFDAPSRSSARSPQDLRTSIGMIIRMTSPFFKIPTLCGGSK